MTPTHDPELEAVRKAILALDPHGHKFARVLHDSIDQLLDGQHTGRCQWSELYKTEKTHGGTLIEINLQREFKFDGGNDLDYSIEGFEVDCKYSQKIYDWMIPPEAFGHLCLVVWASDEQFKWSAGLVRPSEKNLSPSANRDQKRRLNKLGKEDVVWVFKDHPLPPNVFLQLPSTHVKDILNQKSGQNRVNKLFIHAQQKIVGRAAVATAAQQDDFMKRVRKNGGARDKLRPLGIVILGHEHRSIARTLGLKEIPQKGEFVSVSLVRTPRNSGRPSATIDGEAWSIAQPGEPIETAPSLPRAQSADE